MLPYRGQGWGWALFKTHDVLKKSWTNHFVVLNKNNNQGLTKNALTQPIVAPMHSLAYNMTWHWERQIENEVWPRPHGCYWHHSLPKHHVDLAIATHITKGMWHKSGGSHILPCRIVVRLPLNWSNIIKWKKLLKYFTSIQRTSRHCPAPSCFLPSSSYFSQHLP